MGDDEAVLEVARAWQRAIAVNDVAAIAGFMSDDWVLVDQDGMGTKQDFLALVENGQLAHDSMSAVEGTECVRVIGDLALVTSRVLNTARFGGQTYEADEWTTDVFVRRGLDWRCVLSHACPAREADGEH